ncbi:TRAP transporter substrate-binding protein DctP [Polaromonas sp.]|uniref:TRAP transporter substrate-binding protein n=1 Tax=Polaromonas sp. TaxID=1869339 RepID=UPI003BA85496
MIYRRIAGFSKRTAPALAVMVTMALPLTTAHAQEKIRLKFADWMPLSHYTVINGAQPFMSKATELSKGKIEFQYFPAEQLGKAKDLLTLLQTGVADIADISPSYISDKFAMSSVAELPAMFTGACQGTNAYAQLVKQGAILAEKEFKPNGVRVLVSVAYAPYKVLTSKKKIETIKDFSGLKLRTAGGAMDITTTQVEAVPVRMPGPDILPSLTRGTLDGTLAPLQSVKVFDIQTQVKHMTTDVSLGSFITVYAISDRAWNRLPEDVRATLTEAGNFASKNHCEYVDTQEKKVVQDLEKDGVKGNTMAPGQLKALNDKLGAVAAEWASALDKRNRPGTAVLADFRKAVGN